MAGSTVLAFAPCGRTEVADDAARPRRRPQRLGGSGIGGRGSPLAGTTRRCGVDDRAALPSGAHRSTSPAAASHAVGRRPPRLDREELRRRRHGTNRSPAREADPFPPAETMDARPSARVCGGLRESARGEDRRGGTPSKRVRSLPVRVRSGDMARSAAEEPGRSSGDRQLPSPLRGQRPASAPAGPGPLPLRSPAVPVEGSMYEPAISLVYIGPEWDPFRRQSGAAGCRRDRRGSGRGAGD